jgi:hypothetical protein
VLALDTSTRWANVLKLSVKQFLNWGAKIGRIILYSSKKAKLEVQ